MNPFIKKNEEKDEIINNSLNYIHKDFIINVIKSRNHKSIINSINEISSGRLGIEKKTINFGLIDGFYDIYSLSSEILKTNIIINYTKKKH